jgi:asparagine synthase (glutamine-hydrolysing)
MCGFAGFVQYGAAELNHNQRLQILKAMGRSIQHRGPDDEQLYDDGVLSLVYRRLSIVDAQGGRQPIFNESESTLLVCNGEIYNHAEVRHNLAATHRFRSDSDCEVLLHGYEEWGQEVLRKVRGMFAFVLWDRIEQRLILARDRLGIKPLYVCHLPNGILFGSELKALLAHPNCPRETDLHNVSSNPVANAITPTYVKGIAHLPAAHQLIFERGRKAQITPYWKLNDHLGAAPYGLHAQGYVEAFDNLLEESIAEHLQGQTEFGVHLSGGVDSCLIAAIAAPRMPNISSYTITERSNYLAGDIGAAQQVAKQLGMPWSSVLCDFRTFVQDSAFGLSTLEQCTWMMDSPLFDIEWILKRELNRTIRAQNPNLKVLLLGQGADEFAGGYSSRIDNSNRNWQSYLKGEVQHILSVGEANTPLRGGRHSVFLGKRDGTSTLSPYHRMMYLMKRQLQNHNLWHEDRTSASLGMEARVPFLDHRIVELLASVPAKLHPTLFWNKSIIRQALKKRMPNYDIRRPKIGFCWTDDPRSLDMLIENMALSAIDDYREKYVNEKDFAFSRIETDQLIKTVRSKQPGFKAASVLLLEQMSTSIFRANVKHAAQAIELRAHRFEGPKLSVIEEHEWTAIGQLFAQPPYMPFDWHPDHCPQIPVGCEIQTQTKGKDRHKYQLVQDGTVHAEISCLASDTGTKALIRGLCDKSMNDFVVRDWLLHLKLPKEKVFEMLSILLQSGFITTPIAPRKKSTFRSISSFLQSIYRFDQWLEALRRRRQVLEAELHK